MKAVILCGGQGARIREASDSLPKPMLPIGNKPMVWHIMKLLRSARGERVRAMLGYEGWLIKEFLLNYRAMTSDVTVSMGAAQSLTIQGNHSEEDWVVTLAMTGEHTTTGGRVAAMRHYIEKDPQYCLTYGDGLSDVDISQLIAFHHKQGRVATVTAVRPPARFRELRVHENSASEFNEKPQTSEDYLHGGFFVCDGKKLWDYLGNDPKPSLERDPMQELAADQQLSAFKHGGFWQPMDTLREFNLLNEVWMQGTAPWEVWP